MIVSVVCIIINIVWALYCGNLDYYSGFFPKEAVNFTGFNFASPMFLIIILNIISLILLIIFKDKFKDRKFNTKVKIISIIVTILLMSFCTMLVNR